MSIRLLTSSVVLAVVASAPACARTGPSSGVAHVGATSSASTTSSGSAGAALPSAPVVAPLATSPRSNLRAFTSERELDELLAALTPRRGRAAVLGSAAGVAAAPAPAQAEAAAAPTAEAKSKDESITNTQVAGVDEGGIVKVHGEHLVVLRRGRLFTVHVGGDRLEPVASIDAFGPDVDPSGSWYDEMLIDGNTIVVIGYSYQRGGTEIGLFDIDREGRLSYRATHNLRSNDYYSSRNYASRIVNHKLIFYTPSYLSQRSAFPAVRRWHRGARAEEFQPILPPSHVYRPVDGLAPRALHTVTACDLAQRDLPCEATAVLGPAGRVFYVSERAVYVWVTDWSWHDGKSEQKSLVFRMPLDGGGPSALRTKGGPVDQFSFHEDAEHLHVLVRSDAAGDGMWSPEVSAGDVAMVRVPLARFSEPVDHVPNADYISLPRPRGEGWAFQNRFVGGYLLYGTGSSWGHARPATRPALVAFRTSADVSPVEVPLDHPVDRIEALGSDAVVVGGDGSDLHFSSLSLDKAPAVANTYVRRSASQGETRSHGFFYKPEGAHDGILGLPIRGAGEPGYHQLGSGVASIVFLRNRGLEFRPLGELAAAEPKTIHDGCRASCVDWYGNARPIFLRGRVFALMGYEIVEGVLRDGRIGERRRVDFSPRGPRPLLAR